MRLRKGELPPLTGIYTTCKLCNETKDDALFKYNKGKRAGNVCRACDLEKKRKLYLESEKERERAKAGAKAWRENNPEAYTVTKDRYRTEHRDELLAKKRAYQQANKERENQRCTEWYYANKDTPEYKQKIADYRELNKEYLAAKAAERYRLLPEDIRKDRNRKWREANPKKALHYTRMYMLSRERRTPSWADKEAIKDIYTGCPKGYEVDHIVPLLGKLVSGLHVENNLQYLSESTNSSKSAKHYPDEFDDSYHPSPYWLFGCFDGRNCVVPEDGWSPNDPYDMYEPRKRNYLDDIQDYINSLED